MADDWIDRLRFYQELGIDTFYRREPKLRDSPREHKLEAGAWPGEPESGEQTPGSSGPALFDLRPATPLLDFPAARETLEEIRADLGECTRCKLHSGRRTIVFGSGHPRAEVVFVGEGPGAEEDQQGLPFVGRAGQLLTEMINNSAERMKVPLRREHVYICNVIKCRPPGNRAPEKDEMETCSPFLLRQLDAIRPRAIVALGATAARALLNTSEAMARLRGRWFDFRGARLLVTYHPAYLLRDPSKKRDAWQDFQMLLRFLYDKA